MADTKVSSLAAAAAVVAANEFPINEAGVSKKVTGAQLRTFTSAATDPTFDAAGDLLVGTGVDTGGRLAKGTARQILAMNAAGTTPEWILPGSPSLISSTLQADLVGAPSNNGTNWTVIAALVIPVACRLFIESWTWVSHTASANVIIYWYLGGVLMTNATEDGYLTSGASFVYNAAYKDTSAGTFLLQAMNILGAGGSGTVTFGIRRFKISLGSAL